MTERGKFIVIYGANNLGKSTQARLLAEKLNQRKILAQGLKYPIYNLAPTGPRLNAILREKKESVEPEELQSIFAQNRKDYEPALMAALYSGVWVVAEDYVGTGIAWGETYGVPKDVLEKMNAGLLKENLAILLDGNRFTSGKEREHLHEQGGLWERSKEVHLRLAQEYGWLIVDANEPEEKVGEIIWNMVEYRFAPSALISLR